MADIQYFHLRCGGKLVYVRELDEEIYRCELCEARGVPFTESLMSEDDRDENADRFNILPTTFMLNGETITVCELIMTREEFGELVNETIPSLKELDFHAKNDPL